jgi:tRNA A37 threonylcarbamoyladenosine modification protein TsaB
MAAEQAIARGETVTDAQLVPFYLRPPQAEREFGLKKKG